MFRAHANFPDKDTKRPTKKAARILLAVMMTILVVSMIFLLSLTPANATGYDMARCQVGPHPHNLRIFTKGQVLNKEREISIRSIYTTTTGEVRLVLTNSDDVALSGVPCILSDSLEAIDLVTKPSK